MQENKNLSRFNWDEKRKRVLFFYVVDLSQRVILHLMTPVGGVEKQGDILPEKKLLDVFPIPYKLLLAVDVEFFY